MTIFLAVSIVEGDEDADEDRRIEAWQYLIDNGVVWQLQGFFGRMAASLIEQGVCVPRRK